MQGVLRVDKNVVRHPSSLYANLSSSANVHQLRGRKVFFFLQILFSLSSDKDRLGTIPTRANFRWFVFFSLPTPLVAFCNGSPLSLLSSFRTLNSSVLAHGPAHSHSLRHRWASPPQYPGHSPSSSHSGLFGSSFPPSPPPVLPHLTSVAPPPHFSPGHQNFHPFDSYNPRHSLVPRRSRVHKHIF